MQSSLKNICKSLKFFNELDWNAKHSVRVWKDGSLRTKFKPFPMRSVGKDSKKTEEQPSVVLNGIKTFKHESLILAQDERWRRA